MVLTTPFIILIIGMPLTSIYSSLGDHLNYLIWIIFFFAFAFNALVLKIFIFRIGGNHGLTQFWNGKEVDGVYENDRTTLIIGVITLIFGLTLTYNYLDYLKVF